MKTLRRPFRKTSLAVAAVLVVSGGSMEPALGAVSCTWDPATGNWSNASGWSCGVVPTGPDQDTALITLGKTVTVDNAQSIYTLNNAGTVAISSASLTLQDGGATNSGLITIATGSALNQAGSAITGGTITTNGTGALVASSNGNNILSGVTINGLVDVSTAVNARERIGNGLTLNGTVNIANGGVLSLDSTLGATNVIGGNGTFNLNDANAHLAVEGNGTTTLGSGIVVRGQGNVGTALFSAGTNTLTNQGRVSADVGGATLTLAQPGNSGSVVNTGTLDARNGGTLTLSSNIANTGGTISAHDGSIVLQNGVTISGGAISTLGTGTFMVSSNGNNVLDNVSLTGNLDLKSVTNAREIIVNGALLNGAVHIGNGGVLSLDSAATSGGAQTLSGTVTVNLDDASARLAIEGDGATTLGSGVTVRGQGEIGFALFAGGANTLTNQGRISADVANATLTIDRPGDSGSFVNSGTLQAVNGGTLVLSTNITANAGSKIVAGTGSTVLQNGVAINGVFTASGGGLFTASSNSNNLLNGVTFTGALDASSVTNARERIGNGLSLDGSIDIGNGGVVSLDSTIAADNVIGGTATINLKDGSALLAIEGNGTTTLGTGVTVHGQGAFGQALFAGGNNRLTNDGLVSADVSGATLTIQRPADSGSFVNNGTLQAVNGGNLRLTTDIDARSGSKILAADGSTVTQDGVVLNGVITTVGSGKVVVTSNGSNVLNATQFTGTLDAATVVNARERIANGMTLNGVIDIANGGVVSLDSTLADPAGNVNAISGSGTFNLNDANALLAIEGNGTTTLGQNIVIRGQGTFGRALFSGGANALTNNGRISADVGGGTLNLVRPANSGTFTNANLVDARNGGTLLLSTDVLNAAGTIAAQAGSTLVQNGVRITGGNITTTGSGSFEALSDGNNYLDGTRFSGTLDLATALNARERIVNGATLNGVVDIANGGILSLDSADTAGGAQTIAGTVSINLDDANARLSVEGNGSTTLGTGVTIHGQGVFGSALFSGGNNTLTNHGLVSADVAGTTLELRTPGNSGSFVNDNVLEARNGGTLVLSTSVANAAGQINALANSVVLQNGVRISGGALGSVGSGAFIATSNGDNFLDGVTLNGVLDLTSIVNARERIVNGATIDGAINIANGGILSLDSTATTGGTQTIGGTGVINLNDANARLSLEGNGSTTLGAGLTVRGQGNIGTALFSGGNNTLTNNGVIVADGGTLTISAPANSGTLAGSGTLQAKGGTLDLALGQDSTQGRLAVGAAGSSVNLHANNITVTTDYTNAQSGSGDTFDRHAGIVGTGQILAGGDARQVITGRDVTAGDTASAVLTIGNVRVGTTTYAYQVANAGTTGPTLRGAIQTGVNGANLTDTRLSGTGVTGGTFDAGAPGSSTGDLGVSFTVATSGALAPLTNQSVNLRSNFDNIADQNLAIVIGRGAGAYVTASGAVQTPALNFGTVQVGQSVSQGLVVRNTATGANGYVEDLNASFGASSGTGAALVQGTGSFSGILAGANSTSANGAMTVAVDTATAGTVNGGITVDYATNGTVNGVSNGLGVAVAGNKNYAVAGLVVNRASPKIANPTIDLGVHRVGDAATTVAVSLSNQIVGTAQAALNASISSNGSPFAANGSVSLLAPGASSTGLTVSLDNQTAGNFTGANAGSASVALVSDASNIGNCGTHCALALPGQTVALSGKVYTPAVAQVNTPTVDFGIVHVNQAVATKGVSVTNAAATTALNDTLTGTLAGATGSFTATGALSGVSAQATDASSLRVGVDTSQAGLYTGSATATFASHDADLADASLGQQTVALKAQVNNYATAALSLQTGTAAFSHVGDTYTLDFGSLTQGSVAHTSTLAAFNSAPGLADLLSGSFDLSGAGSDFSFAGFNSFSGLGAGQSQGGYSITLASNDVGSFDDVITLHAVGSNASGYSGSVNDLTLVLEGRVTGTAAAVPEPGSFALFFAGLAALAGLGRRNRHRSPTSNL